MNPPPSTPKLLHSVPWYLFVVASLAFFAACLSKPGAWLWADLIWLIAAAINLHLINSQSYGLKTARRWLLIVIAGSFAAGFVNQFWGVLFGQIRFHKAFGAGLLGVPVGWLLLWTIVIFGARSLASWIAPRASHVHLALLSAAFAMATMLNVQPLAVVYRNWWTVFPSGDTFVLPAWIVWFVIPAVLAFFLREPSIQKPGQKRRGAIILPVFNLCALLARVA